jgi:hypothetical protein
VLRVVRVQSRPGRQPTDKPSTKAGAARDGTLYVSKVMVMG